MFGLVWLCLLLGALVDSVHALKFNFTDVPQCEQISVAFSGNTKTRDVPATLSIVPFNATPIAVVLPNSAIADTGVAITFLPFVEGTNFIASLDDALGDNVIDVSDILRVLPSDTGRSDCISPPSTTPRAFQVPASVAQCENFTVTYDTSRVSQAPNIRLMNPRGAAFTIDALADDRANGTATYMMNFERGKEIVLVLDDGGIIRETTPLLTVQGDFVSSKACLNQKKFEKSSDKQSKKDTADATTVSASGSPTASQAVIIGSASGGAAVVLIGVCMAVFIWRDRRKRRLERTGGDIFTTLEKATQGQIGSPPVRPRRPSRGLSTLNPLYTRGFMSSTLKSNESGSLRSWIEVNRDQRTGSPLSPTQFMSRSGNGNGISGSPRSMDNLSIRSLDIEGMLNLATIQSEGGSLGGGAGGTTSRKNSEGVAFGAIVSGEPITMPQPVVSKPQSAERHLRNPSDVPADFNINSKTFSGYSSLNGYGGALIPSTTAIEGNAGYPDRDNSNLDTGRITNPFASTISLVEPAFAPSENARIMDAGGIRIQNRNSSASSVSSLASESGTRPSPSSPSKRGIIANGLPSSPRNSPRSSATQQDRTRPSSERDSSRTTSSAWYGIAS